MKTKRKAVSLPAITALAVVCLGADGNGCGDEDEETPSCISDMIDTMEEEPAANPPASITRYEYEGETVYYVPQRCCDIPSVLYDSKCEVICSPDGGLSGDGDGRCPDFFDEATDKTVIWEDDR